MFEFDAGKLIIIAIVALIVIGPKDLPRVLRHVGQAVGKMRRMAADFQGQFMEAMREADLADAKAEVEKLAKIGTPSDPLADVSRDIRAALEKPETAEQPSPDADAALAATVSPRSGDVAGEATEPQAIDAEMKALAHALNAEIAHAPVDAARPDEIPPASETKGDGGRAHEKA